MAKIVKKYITHGQYGSRDANAPCILVSKSRNPWDLKLSGNTFLKSLQLKTTANENGSLLYKKTEDIVQPNLRNKSFLLYNSWVILHTFYIFGKYKCNMNFEFCTTIEAVKYLFKYVYKKNDYAKVALQDRNNKVKCYLSS